MILVTTAGKVGAEAARLLRERDVPVRVLVRDPAQGGGRRWPTPGAEIAAGDLDVPASIDDAMAGVSAVVLVSPAVPAQELNVVASAARAGAGARRQGDQQGLGRLADRPAARAGRDRGGPGRRRDPAHAAAVQRLHAERPRPGPGHRHDQQLRLRSGQGPRRAGRRPRRRRRGRRRSPPPPPRTPGRPTGSPARNWSPTTTWPPCCRSCSAGPSPTGSSPSRRTRTR